MRIGALQAGSPLFWPLAKCDPYAIIKYCHNVLTGGHISQGQKHCRSLSPASGAQPTRLASSPSLQVMIPPLLTTHVVVTVVCACVAGPRKFGGGPADGRGLRLHCPVAHPLEHCAGASLAPTPQCVMYWIPHTALWSTVLVRVWSPHLSVRCTGSPTTSCGAAVAHDPLGLCVGTSLPPTPKCAMYWIPHAALWSGCGASSGPLCGYEC
jgi:hypothetical protein